jgi:lipopolysaccharide transport system permease protein
MLRSAWRNRALILALSKRDIRGRYRGSVIGIFWSLLNPLLMLAVFTFVFGEIFQARWAGSQQTGGLDYAAALFSGLLIFNLFSECIGKAPGLIFGNANYVKKVVFPLEVLAIVTLITATFHLLIAYGILLVLILLSGWVLSWTALLLPLIFAPFMLMVLGFTWGLAALGVYLRDISQLVGPGLTATMFLTPIFYPLSSVSSKLLPIFMVNPLTFIIEQVRAVLLHQSMPDWRGLLIYSLISCVILMVGFALFQKMRKGFADVL